MQRGNIDTVPENLLMWFHHVPWDRRMDSGRLFWDELVYRYQMGVQYVTWMREAWDSLERRIDARRFSEVRAKLETHETDAANWRDTSVNYWKEFSGRAMPVDDAPLSASIVVAGKRIGGFDLSAPSYTVDLDTAIGGSNEFGSAQLGSQWQWVRPDDTRWHLAGGSLVITSQSGDLQGNANTARNLALQEVNGDWTADTKAVFSRPLANNNEQGGIIAHADDNYVKLAWEMADAGAEIDKLRVVVIREQNGVPTTFQVTGSDAQRIVGADGAIWFRLRKAGDTYKAYYSREGDPVPPS